MKASIIIPTFSRANQLSRTLNSLREIDFEPINFEIIVIDNGSTDNTKLIVEQYIIENSHLNISYFFDATPGLLTGRHLGAEKACGEILIFIDDDIWADKNWLKAIVESFERQSDVHIVGGKCLPNYEVEPPIWLNYFKQNFDGAEILPHLSLCDYGESEREINPTYVWGLNFSIRKTSFYELGGFHPDNISPEYQHFQGDGETGISIKAIELGYKAWYNPKVLVYHEVPKERMTVAYFEKRLFYQGICNSYTEIRKNKGIKNGHQIKSSRRKIKDFLSINSRFLFANKKLDVKPVTLALNDEDFKKEVLFERLRSFELAGYSFHQEIAKKTPSIMQWILKENYFDYKLPTQ